MSDGSWGQRDIKTLSVSRDCDVHGIACRRFFDETCELPNAAHTFAVIDDHPIATFESRLIGRTPGLDLVDQHTGLIAASRPIARFLDGDPDGRATSPGRKGRDGLTLSIKDRSGD